MHRLFRSFRSFVNFAFFFINPLCCLAYAFTMIHYFFYSLIFGRTIMSGRFNLYSTYVFNFVFLVFELFSISRLWVDPIASIFRYEILKVKKYSLWIFGVKRSLKHKDRDADRFWCCGKSDPNSTINLSSGGSHAVPRVAPWGSSFSSSFET